MFVLNSLCVSTVRCLGGVTGSMLLGMTRDELKTVCPEEGGRVFYQLQNVKSALAVRSSLHTWCQTEVCDIIFTQRHIHSLQVASEVRPMIWGRKLPVNRHTHTHTQCWRTSYIKFIFIRNQSWFWRSGFVYYYHCLGLMQRCARRTQRRLNAHMLYWYEQNTLIWSVLL